ncbi:SGNH/GDSL hydrolase family protein [Scytonema sp. NUACC26]|uniref:SGNH/GDSL hydrolase family protein n=1 Tax=Scytonema sp. NUACC26 TaxID=3140176 RepID=UPI0034DC2A6C
MHVNLYDMVNQYRHLSPDLEGESFTPDTRGVLQFQNKYTALYVFGDSLSDLGNAFDATKKAKGEGSPPSPPYFQGHFSNGLVWVEYLALLMGLTTNRSTNFATGGANTGSANTMIPDNPLNLPGLQQQINNFTASVKENRQDVNSQGLYIVWAGSNDYLGGGVTDPTLPIQNLVNAVSSLAKIGARNILVLNLPDLGVVPLTRNDSQKSILLNELTKAHNAGLAKAFDALKSSYDESANIILFDINSIFSQIINNPAKFGFTNVTDPKLNKIAQSQQGTGKFFFWDDLHPTTTTHLMLAKVVFSVLCPDNVSEEIAKEFAPLQTGQR